MTGFLANKNYIHTQETLSKQLTQAFLSIVESITWQTVIKYKLKGQIREKGKINQDEFQEET